MINKIRYNLEQLLSLNEVYMDENTLDDQEDELLEQMDNLVADTVKLVVDFTKNRMDIEAVEKLIRFYPEKLLAIISKAK